MFQCCIGIPFPPIHPPTQQKQSEREACNVHPRISASDYGSIK